MQKILIVNKKTGEWEFNIVKYPLQKDYFGKEVVVCRVKKKLEFNTQKEMQEMADKCGILVGESLIIKGKKRKGVKIIHGKKKEKKR